MFAANGTRIPTYGTIAVTLNLSLRRAFTWRFVIADVQSPIIGVDFLSHYGLLVDPRNKRLIDTRTQLTARGYTGTTDGASVRTIVGESVYHRLLMELPDLTRPPIFEREKVRRGVVHHIETTPGQRSPQRSQDEISSDDRATSDAAIEKFMGVTSARGIEKGRKSATMRRLPRVKRPHHTPQVFPAPY